MNEVSEALLAGGSIGSEDCLLMAETYISDVGCKVVSTEQSRVWMVEE